MGKFYEKANVKKPWHIENAYKTGSHFNKPPPNSDIQ